jgi:hypothetical protein
MEDAMNMKTRMFHSARAWPLALLAAAAVAAPACTTQAYTMRGSYVSADFERRAADNGYREGFDEGRNDARKHRSFSPERHGVYRDAPRNFSGGWERDAYQRGFRRGFEAGYRDGFERYARDDRRDWRTP